MMVDVSLSQVLAWGSRLAPWVLLIKVTVLLGVLLAASAMLRGRAEAMRYPLLLVGFVAIGALPIASAHLPWRLAVLPSVSTASDAPAGYGVANRAALPGSRTNEPDTHAKTTMSSIETTPAESGTDAAPSFVVPAERTEPRWTMDTVRHIVWVAWLAGAIFVIGRFIIGIAVVLRLTRRAEATDAFDGVLAEMTDDLHITRPVRVLTSTALTVPFTWGLRRPFILLPADALEWPGERLRVVLLHELAHVRRCDTLGLTLTRIVCAMYWFHPLIWMTARRLDLARECACDAVVTRWGIPGSRYAEHLLDIARAAHLERQPVGLLRMAKASELRQRLRLLLDRTGPQPIAGPPATIAIVLLLTLSTTALASLSPLVRDRDITAGATGRVEAADTDRPGHHPDAPDQRQTAGSDRDDVREAPPVTALAALSPSPRQAADAGEESPAERRAIETRSWEDAEWGAGTDFGVERNMWSSKVTSFSMRDDDHLVAKWDMAGSTFLAEVQGTIHVTADDRALGSMSRDGFFVVQETRGKAKRRYEARVAEDGAIDQTVYENNRADAFGPADDWVSRAIVAVLRHTGVDAHDRVERIYANDGAEGVFDEIDRLTSDHVRMMYFRALIDRDTLDPRELSQAVRKIADAIQSDGDKTRLLIDVADRYVDDVNLSQDFFRAADTIESDGDRRRLIAEVLQRQGLDESVATLAIEAIAGIDSDGDKASVLIEASRAFALEGETSEAFFKAAETISSSGDRSRVLITVIQTQAEQPGMPDQVLHSAAGIPSDGDKARVLGELIGEVNIQDEHAEAFFKAASSIRSDGDLARVLVRMLDHQELSDGLQNGLLRSAADIHSDGDLASVLSHFAREYAIVEPIGDEFFRAVEEIRSDGDRGRVLKTVAGQNDLPHAMRLRFLDSASGIHSDGDKASVLAASADLFRDDEDLRRAYLRVVDTISNDGDHRRARRAIGAVDSP